ncbi:MAG: hypothetical protein NTX64_19180, partial [Elusimicrobia bacterium]|nr:hypothetical protein [Elusimicrobiota bacterium]
HFLAGDRKTQGWHYITFFNAAGPALRRDDATTQDETRPRTELVAEVGLGLPASFMGLPALYYL